MALTVVLDPGHGKGSNHSPYVSNYYEGNQMFYLGQKLKAELEKKGFNVLITREKITDNPDLAERGSLAGRNGASLFLSLHSNAPGEATAEDGTKYYPESCTGTVVYYSMTRSENKELSDELGKKVSEVMGHYFRGSKTREYPNKPGVDYYGVIRNAAQSGCSCAMLIEHGFHTHIADAEFLLKDENLQKLAEEEAKIISDYFGTAEAVPEVSYEIKTGSVVKIRNGATYWGGQNIPSWVKAAKWIVESLNAKTGRAVINKDESGKYAIMSPIDVKYLELAYTPKEEKPVENVVENKKDEKKEEKTVENTIVADGEITITLKKYGDMITVSDKEKLAEFLK